MKRRELILKNLLLAPRLLWRGDRRPLKLLAPLLGVAGWMAYLLFAWFKLGIGVLVFAAVVYALALVGVAILARGNRRAGESLLKLSGRPSPASDDFAQHRPKIADALLRAALLADRAGCELLHQQGKIPPEATGACRRRTFDLARGPMLWDGLSPEEQNLLIAAEGSWTQPSVFAHLARLEDVRSMRFALGIDEVLAPFEFVENDLRPALELTAHPERVRSGGCLASFDLRPAQGLAQQMFERCVAEGVRRGQITLPDPSIQAWMLTNAERLAASPADDLLIGTTPISAADLPRIHWISGVALRRVRVLTALIDFLNGSSETIFDAVPLEPRPAA